MQRIEPTGSVRLEWYLARILAVLKTGIGGTDKDFLEQLVGYEEEEQTPEAALAMIDRLMG